MSTKPARIKYERVSALDKRIAYGDDFAGDAWVRWVAVGQSPDDDAYERLVEMLKRAALDENYEADDCLSLLRELGELA